MDDWMDDRVGGWVNGWALGRVTINLILIVNF